jgi:phosphotransferase system enzyme I (PtsI)
MTAENGRKHGIPVGMCGEAAREEKLIPLWAGMGLDELSVNAGSILHVKKTILHTSYERAQKLVSEVLNCAADKEVEELLQKK